MEHESEHTRSLSTFPFLYMEMILLKYLISDHLNMKLGPYRNAANQGPNPKLSTCENGTA